MNQENTRVAVVTGASRGIGAAIAERLARDGFAVVVNYAESAAPAEALVRKIEAAGGRAFAARADVSDPAAVRAMFDRAEEAFGGVDVLINNAGLMPRGPLAGVDDDTFARVIDVNLKGSFNTLREAAKRLRDGGRIINFSSSVTSIRQPGVSVYAGTKAAIEAITGILCKELGPRQIRVNAVAPGPVATDLLKSSPKEALDALIEMTPLKRLGQPEDIAAVVSFLAGPDSAWINGQTIRVNGGVV